MSLIHIICESITGTQKTPRGSSLAPFQRARCRGMARGECPDPQADRNPHTVWVNSSLRCAKKGACCQGHEARVPILAAPTVQAAFCFFSQVAQQGEQQPAGQAHGLFECRNAVSSHALSVTIARLRACPSPAPAMRAATHRAAPAGCKLSWLGCFVQSPCKRQRARGQDREGRAVWESDPADLASFWS